MKIFIDTTPLQAIIAPRDQWHLTTLNIFERINDTGYTLITTDYVISEVFTGLLGDKKSGFTKIKAFNSLMYNKRFAQVEWITKDRFLKTKGLFLKFAKDKLWSFTDCVSYVVMKELKIKTVFTFDQHFKQMGFDLLT